MKLCEHGCGQTAQVFKEPSRKVKTGRWQCADHHLTCPAVKQRRYQSNIEKYGVDNPFRTYNADVSEAGMAKKAKAEAKREATYYKRYGVRGGFELESVRSKSIETLQKRYGVSNANNVPGAVEKTAKTMIEKYGTTLRNRTKQFRSSKIGNRWLDEHDITRREVYIKAGGKNYKVDGLDDTGKIVYEFYGNYWHGNPKMYLPDVFNTQAKKSMGELYEGTLHREDAIRAAGYKMVTIWEDDYRNGLK